MSRYESFTFLSKKNNFRKRIQKRSGATKLHLAEFDTMMSNSTRCLKENLLLVAPRGIEVVKVSHLVSLHIYYMIPRHCDVCPMEVFSNNQPSILIYESGTSSPIPSPNICLSLLCAAMV